ncbi:MAG TPA: SDR family NAD(P)-dependent oxidoreductase, partial [Ilumatobacteraceae bacterium]
MDLGIAGRRAAVAAASAGLGHASAEALAAEGVRVAICGRDRARIDDAAARIGAGCVPLVADVSDAEGAAAFVAAATEALGGV